MWRGSEGYIKHYFSSENTGPTKQDGDPPLSFELQSKKDVVDVGQRDAFLLALGAYQKHVAFIPHLIHGDPTPPDHYPTHAQNHAGTEHVEAVSLEEQRQFHDYGYCQIRVEQHDWDTGESSVDERRFSRQPFNFAIFQSNFFQQERGCSY